MLKEKIKRLFKCAILAHFPYELVKTGSVLLYAKLIAQFTLSVWVADMTAKKNLSEQQIDRWDFYTLGKRIKLRPEKETKCM